MKKLLLIILASIVIQYSYGQNDNFWTKSGTATSGRIGQAKGDQHYYDLDLQGLKAAALLAPDRGPSSKNSNVIIAFPNSNGIVTRFSVVSASVFPTELSAKYPGIYSFAGRSVDDPTTIIRFSVSDYNGIHGIILANEEVTFIEPAEPGNLKIHKVYNDAGQTYQFKCATSELEKKIETKTASKNASNARATGPNLRTYRAAISVTERFGDYYAGTGTDQQKRANILAQINSTVTQLNAVFERDLSIALQLVSNEDQILYFTNNPRPIASPQQLLDNVIGFANYDIGHSFDLNLADNYDYLGDAGCVGCVCASSKGAAYVEGRDPSSANFVYAVAHEMGHQMGAYHTQSAVACISGNGRSEVEPASGSTLMSNAGMCDPAPFIQSARDGYYNQISIRQIDSYMYTLACGTSVYLGNSAPSVEAGSNYVIPISTPFVLTGQGSDPDVGDVLTYTWEQNDPQIYNPTTGDVGNMDRYYPAPTKTSGPMFRSYPPSTSAVRTLPSFQTLRNNGPYLFEVLPSVARTLNFVLTVRDNHPGDGRVQFDSMKVTVAGNAGPFAFSGNQSVWTAGATQTVTWNVAGSNTAPVNCQNVKISLSIDGGLTFPYVLIASTANDGTESVTVPPNVSSSTCRLKIEAIGNIFFALSNNDFSITAGGCVATVPSGVSVKQIGTAYTTLAWIRNNNTKYEIQYRQQGTTNWTTQSVTDQPGNYLITANINNLTAATTYEAQVRSLCDGGNTITVRARGVTGQEHINVKVGATTIGSVTLTTSYQNYTYQTSQNGGILVQYDNDQGSRDVQVDYVEVNGEIRQAEAQSFNTGAYLNGSCGGGGNSEWLNCNGSIGFDNVNRNNITIRARGTLGGEHINLRINNTVVANFTLGTTLQNYTATFTTTGGITVEFDNDKANSDVQVDYIIANGIIRQAESQSYNTAFYANGSCGGGGFSEWMNCNGLIGFGNADLPGSGGSDWSSLLTFTVPPSQYDLNDINTLLAIDQINDTQNNLDWLTTPDPATWEGVTWTTTIPKRVLTLNIQGQLLTGKLYAGNLSALQTLNVIANKITALNINGSSALTSLDCRQSALSTLDLSTQTSLTYLYASDNVMQQLTIGSINQLVHVYIDGNQLTSVNLSNQPHLLDLDASSNFLTSLNVSSSVGLTQLHCEQNYITTLNLLPLTQLWDLTCASNKLTSFTTGSNNLLWSYSANNNLPFTELLKVKGANLWGYAPQNEIFTPVNSANNVTINYSSQAGVAGQTTTFQWYKNGALVSTNTTGTFTTTGIGIYYCVMTNDYFPGLTLTTAKTTIGNPSARLAEDPETPSINSAPEEVAAYPNPATHSVVINFPETPSQVVLYTTLGAPVVERTVEGSQMTLDVSDTKPGIYILKISSGKHTYAQRIMIQH